MLEKSGGFIGKNVLCLISETCLKLEIWQVLKTLIIQGVVCVDLIEVLVTKQRSDLLCLCAKHVSDIQSDDFVSIFKYFLTAPKGSYMNMISVRKDWENQANVAIESCSSRRKCSNVDQLTLSYLLSRLSGNEMLSLIIYLGKCQKLGLNACDWVPGLKSIVKYLGLVLDEHFSTLVLYSEFQDELRLINGVVKSLVSEARLCCSVADVVENLKVEIQSQKDA
ncbi:hypothetical protein MKX01_018193 [Papaver californicum]|nr:hypothetical protein MKX01_018193 [Papaver californicum]